MHALCMATIRMDVRCAHIYEWIVGILFKMERNRIKKSYRFFSILNPAKVICTLHSNRINTHAEEAVRNKKRLTRGNLRDFHFGIGNTRVIFWFSEQTNETSRATNQPTKIYSELNGLSALFYWLLWQAQEISHKYIIINYNETTLCEKLNCF